MQYLIYVAYAVYIAAGLLMVGAILLQEGKGGGLSALGGTQAESAFGASNPVRRMTVVLAVFFFLLAGFLSYMSPRSKVTFGEGRTPAAAGRDGSPEETKPKDDEPKDVESKDGEPKSGEPKDVESKSGEAKAGDATEGIKGTEAVEAKGSGAAEKKENAPPEAAAPSPGPAKKEPQKTEPEAKE